VFVFHKGSVKVKLLFRYCVYVQSCPQRLSPKRPILSLVGG